MDRVFKEMKKQRSHTGEEHCSKRSSQSKVPVVGEETAMRQVGWTVERRKIGNEERERSRITEDFQRPLDLIHSLSILNKLMT